MRFAVAVSGSLPLTDSDSSKLKCSRAERCALAARQRTANATPAVRCFFAAGRIYTVAEQIIPAPLADVCGRCAGLRPTGVSTKLYKINLNLSTMMVKNAWKKCPKPRRVSAYRHCFFTEELDTISHQTSTIMLFDRACIMAMLILKKNVYFRVDEDHPQRLFLLFCWYALWLPSIGELKPETLCVP